MAEYLTRDSVESVALNQAIPFIDSIPCNKGYVYHQNGTGILFCAVLPIIALHVIRSSLPVILLFPKREK